MSIYGTLAGLMNVEARTSLLNAEAQDYAVLAQERALNVQAKRQQQADEMQYHQGLLDTIQGNATKIQDGEVVDAGDPLVSGLGKQLQRDQQTATNARRIADAMQTKVSLPYWNKLDQDAREADRVATATATAYRQAQSDLSKHVGSIAGSAVDPNTDDVTFRRAYQQIMQLNPQMARTMDVNRDDNQIPIFGDRSRRAMLQLQKEGMTSGEQIQKEVNIANEIRKEDDDKRKWDDEKRKNRETDSLIAWRQVESDRARAQTAKLEQDADAAKKKSERLQGAAAKSATPSAIDMSRKDIISDAGFKDMKFDSASLDSFAGAVADRANKIIAEADRAGIHDMDYSDARQQAISELRQYVKPATVGAKKWMFTDTNIPGTGEEKFVYQRGGTTAGPAPATAAPKTADEYLKGIGAK